jgi:hypothetical protein
MNTLFRFLLPAIALLAMVPPWQAASAETEAETLQSEVALEPGEIDSSTVEVGAFAVVTNRRGGRHPLSGDYWEQLATARGYIQAVDAETWTLGGDFGPKQIALGDIKTLALVDSGRALRGFIETPSSRLGAVDGFSARPDVGGTGKRITLKLSAGITYGFTSALLGGILGGISGHYLLGGNNCSGDQSCGLAAAYGAIPGWVSGYSIGTAIGVSSVDPKDRFISPLVLC